MMEIALGVLACAVFAALAVGAATAALRSARVDDIIGEVFSPWISHPSGEAERPKAEGRRDVPPPSGREA
ncbi:hypothetical protein [Brevundimonas sp.]|uniref:hypothetical protein n=1 Tax=Brevundimonas sp. TaxID=1871086 RepID=UPI002FCB112B